MLRLKFSGALLFLLLLFASPVNAADPMVVDSIAQKVVCQCGCTMILNNCSHSECGSRETMLGIIKQRLDQGQSSDSIVQAFVKSYGEKVLAEPPKKGFNLTAWLSPFIGLALGVAIIYVALKRWVKRGENAALPATASSGDGETAEAYRLRLEKELKEFPERGFR